MVGVKDYKGTELSNLKYTENDAHELAEVLGKAGYRHVVVLTQKAAFESMKKDRFPTAANIRLHLKAWLEDRREGDTVFVAFSGHGVHLKKQNKLYFCPEGANLERRVHAGVAGRGVRGAEGEQGGGALLVADACRNDPLEGKTGGDERLESVTRPLLPDPPRGVAAIFSCSEGQKSYESDEARHGYFTQALIEGLRGKAANKQGRGGPAGAGAVPDGRGAGGGQGVSDAAAGRRPQQCGRPRGRCRW